VASEGSREAKGWKKKKKKASKQASKQARAREILNSHSAFFLLLLPQSSIAPHPRSPRLRPSTMALRLAHAPAGLVALPARRVAARAAPRASAEVSKFSLSTFLLFFFSFARSSQSSIAVQKRRTEETAFPPPFRA